MGTFFHEVHGAGDPAAAAVVGAAVCANAAPESDVSATAKIAAKSPMRVRISGLLVSQERSWLPVVRVLRAPVLQASAEHIQSWRRFDSWQ